ncbi:MAG: hypothetical protein WBW94_15960 [Anaerolineales bacterium]
MKKLTLIISFLIALALLSACATATTAAPTAFPEITSTSIPTSIPPTATIAPSPTVDPNMPVGATGKDANNNWIKPLLDASGKQVVSENGQPVNETWETYSSGPNGETINGWFVDHIKNPTVPGGIPFEDAPQKTLKPSAMVIDFKVKDGIKAPYLEHMAGSDSQGDFTYSTNALNILMDRYYGKSPSSISTSELRDFLNNKFPNDFSISLTDAQGNPHTIYGDEKFTIVLVDPVDIPNSDFIPVRPNQSTILSFTTFDDKAHSVTILVANTIPFDQLSTEDFMRVVFNPYGHVLAFSDLNPKLWVQEPETAAEATSFATLGLKGSSPYFTLSDSP